MGRKVIRDVYAKMTDDERASLAVTAERELKEARRMKGGQLGQAITDAILTGGLVKGDKKRGGK